MLAWAAASTGVCPRSVGRAMLAWAAASTGVCPRSVGWAMLAWAAMGRVHRCLSPLRRPRSVGWAVLAWVADPIARLCLSVFHLWLRFLLHLDRWRTLRPPRPANRCELLLKVNRPFGTRPLELFAS